MNGWRVAEFGGLALALVMMVLMMVGTHSQTDFITWAVLALVGVGIFAFCRKQDEAIQKRQRVNIQSVFSAALVGGTG